MRFLAAILLLAACAGPKPCTRTLCVAKLDGTMELEAWSGSVRASAETPKPPVVSATKVTMVYGTAEFVNGKTRVTAAEGSVFTFNVSTRAIPSIEVSSGSVTVLLSAGEPNAGAPSEVPPGAPYLLPKP